ncbi:MAG: hypothetical protein ACM3ZD_00740 [Betaproteobacteria bacterium]
MGLELFFGLLTIGLLASVIVKLNRLQADIEQIRSNLSGGSGAAPGPTPD